MQDQEPGLRWGVERRLEFIEFRLYWARYMELAERARENVEDDAVSKGEPEIDLGEEIAEDLTENQNPVRPPDRH